MRLCKLPVAVMVLLLAAGCIPSLHPLYTKETMITEPRLIGEWVEDGTDNLWKFSQVDEFAMELVYTENNEPGVFEVYGVKIGEHLFMDMFPEEPNFKNGLYKGSFLPVHNFARLEFVGDSLHVNMLDAEYIKNEIKQGKTTIAHELHNDEMLLTAPPEELQKFIIQYASDSRAFSVEITLLKK